MTTSMVDWAVAQQTAARLVKPGPEVTRAEAAATVAELRACAERAEAYVSDVTGLVAPSGTGPVLVVDRPGWVAANLDAFRQILSPLIDRAAEKMGGSSAVTLAVGSRVTGAQVGVLLSYLAPKVLGQFDPFFPGAPAATTADGGPDALGGRPDALGGRLLLVAPNIVAVERELRVAPSDFRLWVTLHEETHRVQFTAVPWLRSYLNTQIDAVVDAAELDPEVLGQMIRNALGRVVEGLRGNQEVSLIDLLQTPGQKAVVDRITAVMSLLEGHADVVMDGVGTDVIPTVEQIRAKFTVRREGQGFDKVIRRMLGLDAKMRQYRDGAAFCRTVIAEVGMPGLNRVWTSPETLPTREEIADPQLWLARVPAPTDPPPSGDDPLVAV